MTPGMDRVPKSRTEWVTDQLREAVLNGEIPPGTQVRPRDLEERFQVSSTPVREAIQRLAAERLLITTAQRGAQVAPYDPVELEDIYRLRLMLEPIAAARSVARADDEWRAEVDHSFRAMENIDPGNPAAWTERHNLFHRAVRARCDSHWTLRIIDDLVLHTERYRRLLADLPMPSRPHSEHIALHQACLDADSTRAAELTREHIQGTFDAVCGLLATLSPSTGSVSPVADITSGSELSQELDEQASMSAPRACGSP